MREHDHSSPAILTLITTLLLAACGGSSSGGSSGGTNPATRPADLSTPEDVARRVMLLEGLSEYSRSIPEFLFMDGRQLSPDSQTVGTTVVECEEQKGSAEVTFTEEQLIEHNPYTRENDSEVTYDTVQLDINQCVDVEFHHDLVITTTDGRLSVGADSTENFAFSWPHGGLAQTRWIAAGSSPGAPLQIAGSNESDSSSWNSEAYVRVFDSYSHEPGEKGLLKIWEESEQEDGTRSQTTFHVRGAGDQQFYTMKRISLPEEDLRITEGQFSLSIHRQETNSPTCPAPGTFDAEITTLTYPEEGFIPLTGEMKISAGDTEANVTFTGAEEFVVSMNGVGTTFGPAELTELEDTGALCFGD